MKKNLTLLTGIVFIITILVAGGCGNCGKKKIQKLLENDSTKVVYLKDTLIDERVHLEMYNSKKPDEKVIDSLVTVVYPGYTVVWEKAHGSNIKEINDIRPIEDDGNIFSKGVMQVMSLFTLEIPPDANPDTVKYEIVFTIKQGGGTWCIDPYLRIPGP